MTSWHSLYLRQPQDNVVDALRAVLLAAGYQQYNPFGLMPSKPYKITQRLFVAPAQDGWTRIIGAPDAALLPALSAEIPLLWFGLEGEAEQIAAFVDGAEVDVINFAERVVPQANREAIERAWHDAPLRVVKRQGGLPVQVLPVDVQALAGGVDAGQAGKMFEKLSGELMRKVGGDANAAQALINPADAPVWDSAGGARIRGLAAALHLPQAWAAPDFVTLRDAYQAAARKQRNPNAALYPGDAEALAAVKEPLAYMPMFAGKDS
jgi:hypothetical protein